MSLRNNFYFLPDRWSLSPLSVQQEALTLSKRGTPMVSNTGGSWILSMWVRNQIPVYSIMLTLMPWEALSSPTSHKYADLDTFSVLKYSMTFIQFCKISLLKCGNSPFYNFNFFFTISDTYSLSIGYYWWSFLLVNISYSWEELTH